MWDRAAQPLTFGSQSSSLTSFLIRIGPTLLGMQVRRLHRDGVTVDCLLLNDLRISVGIAHDGFAAAMAYAVVGIALHRHFPGKRRIATVDLKLNYFPAVHADRISHHSHL